MITVEMEEKMSLSCLHGSNLCPIIQECETKGRRKRKKARAEAANGEAKKRRLSDEQVKFLEMNFGKEQKLESGRKVHLATELSLDPKQVAVWFQNRRARWKNKQLEEEYMKLKTVNKNIVIEKCHLENEVLKLKERLSEAQKEIKKLSGSLKEVSAVAEASDSPSPPLSTTTKQPPFKGIGWNGDSAPFKEFGWEGDTDIMYVNEYKNYMEWFDFYYGI